MFFSSDYELQLSYFLPTATVLKENEVDKEDQIVPNSGSDEEIDETVLRSISNCKTADKAPGEYTFIEFLMV